MSAGAGSHRVGADERFGEMQIPATVPNRARRSPRRGRQLQKNPRMGDPRSAVPRRTFGCPEARAQHSSASTDHRSHADHLRWRLAGKSCRLMSGRWWRLRWARVSRPRPGARLRWARVSGPRPGARPKVSSPRRPPDPPHEPSCLSSSPITDDSPLTALRITGDVMPRNASGIVSEGRLSSRRGSRTRPSTERPNTRADPMAAAPTE